MGINILYRVTTECVFMVRAKPKRFLDKCAVCTYKYTL